MTDKISQLPVVIKAGIIAVIILIGFVLTLEHSLAGSVRPSWDPWLCIRHGARKDCGNTSYSEDNINRQIWGYEAVFVMHGHGNLTEVDAVVCMAYNYNALWEGPCDVIGVTNDDIGTSGIDFSFWRVANIGDNYTLDFNWIVLHELVEDAEVKGYVIAYERWVEITNFGLSTGSAPVGQNFNVDWSTDQALGGVLFYYSGPVSCPVGVQAPVSASGSVTCQGIAPGTGTFWIEATGPSGSGPRTIRSASEFLNITSTSVCGNGVVDAGEQCDGGNLNGQTCASNTVQNYADGTLSCNPAGGANECKLNLSSCGRYKCTGSGDGCALEPGDPGPNQCSPPNDPVCLAPTPPPTCSPLSQTVDIGQTANFNASDGDGSFSWSAPGGSPNSGSGGGFSTSYSSAGTKTVTVTSAGQNDTCSVEVNASPLIPGGPIVNIACTPETVPYNNSANVSWSSENTSSCVVEENGSPRWFGVSGNESTDPLTLMTTYTATCQPITCTSSGGSVTMSGSTRIHTFTGSGTFNMTCPGTVEYLVVGGGGGGGNGVGGGGGAGGFRTSTISVSAGDNPVVVGSGGGGASGSGANGGDGGNSSFAGIVSNGGGGGGGWVSNGRNGGSGGGAGGGAGDNNVGGSGISGQGNAGGDSIIAAGGGGGGGAGARGSDAENGNGGNGLSSSISGSSVTYAGGGGGDADGGGSGGSGGGGSKGGQGGGCDEPAVSSQHGTPNTGGGGAGGQSCWGHGGNGGSGIVIIRYTPVQFSEVSDACTVNVDSPTPTTSNVSVTEPNYCTSGPAITANWDYSDPSGSPQSAYQVQVDNQPAFNSPEVDSGKITCESCRSYFTGTGILQFNTTYTARVRTWNTSDSPSAWQEATICSGDGCLGDGSSRWKTPSHAYPNPNASYQFTLSPPNPAVNSPVQFTDNTLFAPSSNNKAWSWTFVPTGGGSGSSTAQNPSYTFDSDGIYQVTESVRDNALPPGQYCAGSTQAVNIQKPIPIWKEIAPR